VGFQVFNFIIVFHIMFLTQCIGYLFLLAASISSSISMNFQKLAQHELYYTDPRTRLHKRATPIQSSVFFRPLFIVAIFLSFAASVMDFLALTWLPPMTVGVFGAVSIIINLLVSKIVLFEHPDSKEWMSIGCVIMGCILAISSHISDNNADTPPELLERWTSCIYIVANWTILQLCAVTLEHATLPKVLQRFGFPFIGGALGAQNVCMGKYVAFVVDKWSTTGQLTTRVDVLVAVILLLVASVIVHIVWLNKGLAKHDAYFCIIVYQSSWFLFTTLSGIVVYNNMATMSGLSQFMFFSGCSLAMYGVWEISMIHKDSNER